MMYLGQNRRRSIRQRLESSNIQVFIECRSFLGVINDSFPVSLLDFTPDGIAFETNEMLSVGQGIRVVFRKDNGSSVHIHGKVRYRHTGIRGIRFGVQFRRSSLIRRLGKEQTRLLESLYKQASIKTTTPDSC